MAGTTGEAGAMAVESVEGKAVTLNFDSGRCIHARRCVMGQPGVFRANVKGAWLDPDAATADELLHVAMNCPSGAITIARKDGGPDEMAPKANIVMVRENGPLAFHGELSIKGQPAGFRATLCRCGASAHKPYCDGSHVAAGFTASGEPAARESALAIVDLTGPVAITPITNGPLAVTGKLEIESGTGRNVNRVTKTTLCRCGHSSNKPYCDGSHAKIGFVAD